MAEIVYSQPAAEDITIEADDSRGHWPAATGTARPKRRALTAEEKLANALADVASLQEKVTALRDSNRQATIEELFRRFEIDEIEGDLSETKRCDALLRKF